MLGRHGVTPSIKFAAFIHLGGERHHLGGERLHLGGERHYDSKVSRLRTQYSVPGQGFNPDYCI